MEEKQKKTVFEKVVIVLNIIAVVIMLINIVFEFKSYDYSSIVVSDPIEDLSINQFNGKFEIYEGTKNGTQLKQLIKTVTASNHSNPEQQVTLVFGNSGSTALWIETIDELDGIKTYKATDAIENTQKYIIELKYIDYDDYDLVHNIIVKIATKETIEEYHQNMNNEKSNAKNNEKDNLEININIVDLLSYVKDILFFIPNVLTQNLPTLSYTDTFSPFYNKPEINLRYGIRAILIYLPIIILYVIFIRYNKINTEKILNDYCNNIKENQKKLEKSNIVLTRIRLFNAILLILISIILYIE